MTDHVDLQNLKTAAVGYPEPLKTLILTAKDSMSKEELLAEFLRWRKLARIQDAEVSQK